MQQNAVSVNFAPRQSFTFVLDSNQHKYVHGWSALYTDWHVDIMSNRKFCWQHDWYIVYASINSGWVVVNLLCCYFRHTQSMHNPHSATAAIGTDSVTAVSDKKFGHVRHLLSTRCILYVSTRINKPSCDYQGSDLYIHMYVPLESFPLDSFCWHPRHLSCPRKGCLWKA